jgi:archaeosine synthase beta-subunit
MAWRLTEGPNAFAGTPLRLFHDRRNRNHSINISFRASDEDILALRGSKANVDPRRPYAFLVEPEYSASGRLEDVATIFLTNRECPFRCLMCDLWKNTTDARVPLGSIPEQIDFALARLPRAKHIKLYNSGNFFDPQAIPVEDYSAIAQRLNSFETVIVENHPKLCTNRCLNFRDLLSGELEIAMGLETIHPHALERLNKQMTVEDFADAAAFLTKNGIPIRAFILVRPPFLSEDEGLYWAVRSLEFAFEAGVRCCSVIPTRAGNGIMEQLQQRGDFTPPRLKSLESAIQAGLALGRGRVFADLWDIEKLFDCQRCGPQRRDRLQAMNESQKLLPEVYCEVCAG